MMVVNGKEKDVENRLNDFGLSKYEARMYFTLLTIGEAKVMDITRRASVPQSKSYYVLDNLIAKGFVEQTRAERPKLYRAKVLDDTVDLIARRKEKEIHRLYKEKEKLKSILRAISPLHKKYSSLRLFTPSYQRHRIKGGGLDG